MSLNSGFFLVEHASRNVISVIRPLHFIDPKGKVIKPPSSSLIMYRKNKYNEKFCIILLLYIELVDYFLRGKLSSDDGG